MPGYIKKCERCGATSVDRSKFNYTTYVGYTCRDRKACAERAKKKR